MGGRVIGWGSDTLDKAPFKAMTGAVKYALRMNFLIPDENDPEDTTIEQLREGNKEQPQTQRASRPATNPDAEEPNDYDVHMDQSAEKQYPTPRLRPDGPRISEAQAKRFFGIAMGAGKTKQQINNYLGGNGYERSDEIVKSEYEKHCEWAAAK
jgi:arylamine N-acetyltransferase